MSFSTRSLSQALLADASPPLLQARTSKIKNGIVALLENDHSFSVHQDDLAEEVSGEMSTQGGEYTVDDVLDVIRQLTQSGKDVIVSIRDTDFIALTWKVTDIISAVNKLLSVYGPTVPISEIVNTVWDDNKEHYTDARAITDNIQSLAELNAFEVNQHLRVSLKPGIIKRSPTRTVSRREVASQATNRPTNPTASKISPYDRYMTHEMNNVMKLFPGLDQKDAFKVAFIGWKFSPANPKNEGRDFKTLLEEHFTAEAGEAERLIEKKRDSAGTGGFRY